MSNGTEERHSSESASNRSLLIWSIAVAVPLALAFAVPVFNQQSAALAPAAAVNPIAWSSQSRTVTRASTQQTRSVSAASVDQLIGGLEQRLENNPTDSKGWALLAQSYAFLGDAERAESALMRAVELGLDEDELRDRVATAAQAWAHPTTSKSPSTGGDIDSIDIAFPSR